MGQDIEITIDNQGRIVIPESLRNQLGLQPGMTLVVEKADDDNVRLSPLAEAPTLIDEGGILVITGEPLSDVSDITRQERDRRISDLLQRVGL